MINVKGGSLGHKKKKQTNKQKPALRVDGPAK